MAAARRLKGKQGSTENFPKESHSSEEQGDNNDGEDVDVAWLRIGNR